MSFCFLNDDELILETKYFHYNIYYEIKNTLIVISQFCVNSKLDL